MVYIIIIIIINAVFMFCPGIVLAWFVGVIILIQVLVLFVTGN
jgi:hypothetical protein